MAKPFLQYLPTFLCYKSSHFLSIITTFTPCIPQPFSSWYSPTFLPNICNLLLNVSTILRRGALIASLLLKGVWYMLRVILGSMIKNGFPKKFFRHHLMFERWKKIIRQVNNNIKNKHIISSTAVDRPIQNQVSTKTWGDNALLVVYSPVKRLLNTYTNYLPLGSYSNR